MSAALDCPGYFAICSDDRMMLLGELTARIDRLVHIGESCSIVGWRLGGRARTGPGGRSLATMPGGCSMRR